MNTILNTKFNALLVALFCLLIAVPILVKPFISSTENTQLSNENRLAAQWPATSTLKKSFTLYSSQVNDYLNDHLVFRQGLLDFYAHLHYKLLRTGSGRQVVIGEDGWLFLANTNALDNARGIVPLDPKDAQIWVDKVRIIRDEVESYGGQFLVVLVPDKPQVYPEHLPKHVVYQRAGRRADTLGIALEKSDLNYIDLLDPLLQAKQKHASPIYSKTDTHWSFVGSLVGYQTIIKKLNTMGLDLPVVKRLQLKIVNHKNFSGDLARLLNLEQIFSETLRMLLPLRRKEAFARNKELLLLGDSFVGFEVDYLDYSFIKSTCIHHDWGNINLEKIKQQQADVVILQMVERALEYPISLDATKTLPCGDWDAN